MFNITNKKIDILVELENGTYYFDEQSGTGKTRLYSVLKEYSTSEAVGAYTYQDLQLGIPFELLIKPGQQKLAVIDRYDMYINKFKDTIEEFGKHGIILIDCKSDMEISAYPCSIDMEKESIEVFET